MPSLHAMHACMVALLFLPCTLAQVIRLRMYEDAGGVMAEWCGGVDISGLSLGGCGPPVHPSDAGNMVGLSTGWFALFPDYCGRSNYPGFPMTKDGPAFTYWRYQPEWFSGGFVGMQAPSTPRYRSIILPRTYQSNQYLYGFTFKRDASFESLGIPDGVTWTMTWSGGTQQMIFETRKNGVSPCIPDSGCGGSAVAVPHFTPFFGSLFGGTVLHVTNFPFCLDDETVDVYCRFAQECSTLDVVVPGFLVSQSELECTTPFVGFETALEVSYATHDPSLGPFDRESATWVLMDRDMQFLKTAPAVTTDPVLITVGESFRLAWNHDELVTEAATYVPDPLELLYSVEILAFNGDGFETALEIPVGDPNQGELEMSTSVDDISSYYFEYTEDLQVAVVVLRVVAAVQVGDKQRPLSAQSSSLSAIVSVPSDFSGRRLPQMATDRKLVFLDCPMTPWIDCGDSIFKSLPPCPTSARLALTERNVWKDDLACLWTWGCLFPTTCHIFHPGACGCFRASGPGQTGQQCCYNLFGALITDPRSGGGTADCYGADGGLINHFLHDTLPYMLCCIQFPYIFSCDSYYEQRPTDDGSDYVPPRPPGGAFGDPHLRTFDGVDYDFNGAGEYVAFCGVPGGAEPLLVEDILSVCDPSINRLTDGRAALSVHFRFAPAGSGTVTVAIGIEDPLHRDGKHAITIMPHPTRRLDIFDGATRIEFPPGGETQTQILLKCGGSLTRTSDLTVGTVDVTIVSPSGLTLRIAETNGVMTPALSVPSSFMNGRSLGLFGFPDGDSSNDFTDSAGAAVTVPEGLPTGSKSSLLFNFGQSWMIRTRGASLFQAFSGSGSSQDFFRFYNPNFVPSFEAPQMSEELQAQAEQACGGIEDEAIRNGCLFDIAVTGEVELFEEVSQRAVLEQSTVEVLTNNPPLFTLEANQERTIEQGQTAEFLISAQDPDGDDIYMILDRNDGDAFFLQDEGNGQGTIIFSLAVGVPGIYKSSVMVTDGTTPILFTATVNVVQPTNQPPVAACINSAVSSDSECSAEAASIDNGSYDPDGNLATCTQSPPGPYPVGDTTVALTCTDLEGESNSCTATITVLDVIPPSISCLADIVAGNDPSVCGAGVWYATPVGTDDCPNSNTEQTMGLPSGAAFSIGTTENKFEVTDSAGNTAMCSFEITVNDEENPVITCPSDITASTDTGKCGAVITWPDPLVSDNCGIVSTTSCTSVSGDFFGVGTTLVSCTVTDEAGNAASCDFHIAIADVELPTINCNAPPTITPPDSPICFVATAEDNCDIAAVEVVDYDCWKFTKKGKRISKLESCVVDRASEEVCIHDSGGVDDHIGWSLVAEDSNGNVEVSTCEILVVNPGKKKKNSNL